MTQEAKLNATKSHKKHKCINEAFVLFVLLCGVQSGYGFFVPCSFSLA